MYYNGQIDGQNDRNQYLTDQIAAARQADRGDRASWTRRRPSLLARKEVIEELQANRSQMVHLFDSNWCARSPTACSLTSIKQDGDDADAATAARSPTRASATYMRNLEGSGWMTNPDLAIIEAQG